jgi:hypothetical protein
MYVLTTPAMPPSGMRPDNFSCGAYQKIPTKNLKTCGRIWYKSFLAQTKTGSHLTSTGRISKIFCPESQNAPSRHRGYAVWAAALNTVLQVLQAYHPLNHHKRPKKAGANPCISCFYLPFLVSNCGTTRRPYQGPATRCGVTKKESNE